MSDTPEQPVDDEPVHDLATLSRMVGALTRNQGRMREQLKQVTEKCNSQGDQIRFLTKELAETKHLAKMTDRDRNMGTFMDAFTQAAQRPKQ